MALHAYDVTRHCTENSVFGHLSNARAIKLSQVDAHSVVVHPLDVDSVMGGLCVRIVVENDVKMVLACRKSGLSSTSCNPFARLPAQGSVKRRLA